MELPQPRPFKSQGREPTHDFLSLCTHPTLHPDPKPTPSSSSQGSHLKTHDFLQPLECVSGAKEEETSRIDTTSSIASVKPPLQHVLPGGIGTYTISSIPYLHNHPTTMGQWPAQSLTNNNPLSGFSSRSSSQGSGLKSQSFMDMIRSAKGTSQDDDLDDEEDFIMKKESSSTSQIHTVDLRVKAEARGVGNNDPKLNTPRSKHSATEQRRRSKINDRFHTLRQLIPNSDQKRDKASFLLEVIEYIQFLQEKTHKYETPYQGWNQEPAKLLNWQRSNQQLVPEGTVAFAPKLEEEKNNIPVLATALGVVTTHLHTRVAPSETVEPSLSSRSHTQPLKEEEEEGDDEEVHEGNISISSVYSQGLVKRLREALEKSGVDLTKTSISVQIELATQSSSLKDHEVSEPVSRTGNDKQTRRPKRLKTYNTS